MIIRRSLFCLLLATTAAGAVEPSTCHGTTSDGMLENGWKLPPGGSNFEAYSKTGHLLGRTYVHSTVYRIVIDTYAALQATHPDKTFVYGETGFRDGGEFKPHKTHRNGLSVDFMVPVVNRQGESVELPTSAFNQWGYKLEFDGTGRLHDLRIDAEALAEHIYELHKAAERHGAGIRRVIFDPYLQPMLHETARWEFLEENVRFSSRRSWVRHDEHYHVDFEVACEE